MRYPNIFFFLLIILNVNSQIFGQDLLVQYGFNGTTEDESGNDYDAINYGASFVEDRFGNLNSAIYFDGVNDFIELPNISELKPSLPVSFSFWIKYDSYSISDREVFNTSFEEDRNTGVFF